MAEDVADAARPVVSVIITNYNYGRFLPRSIGSVLGQSLGRVECIVVDDGSTDGSQDYIRSCPGVTALFQQNKGQAAALRAGARVARGDIIISLDADDFLYEDACAAIIEVWRPDCSCLSYRLDVYHNDEKTDVRYPTEEFLDDGQLDRLAVYGYYPSPPMSGNAFEAGYLRMLLDRAIHLDGDGVDAYLLYSAPVFGRVAHIDRALGGYRMHGENISMSSGRKTVKNLGDHIYYQYWAERNAARFAAERHIPYAGREGIKGPYLLLWYLMVADGNYTRWPLPRKSRLAAGLGCMTAFLSYPNLTLAQRIKNAVLALALTIMPKSVRLPIERRLVDF